jgi:Novel STAND NTPase 1
VLKKHPSEWLTVAPFRPQDDPLAELALAFVDTFEALGHPCNWGDIPCELKAVAEDEPADGQVLLTLARELTSAAKQREATVALTIDQAEALFSYGPVEPATRCLRLLRAALEVSDQQLMTIAMMRADFLGAFQTHRALQDQAYDPDFPYRAIPVDPMPERSFADIIRGPAQLAGLRLEDGLVDTMVSDTGTRDALPLLAFTLRRLCERYAEDGLLVISSSRLAHLRPLQPSKTILANAFAPDNP